MRFKHLGKAGSQANIDGVNAVIRRGKIEQLTSAIEALYESWLDLYPDEEKAGHRVESFQLSVISYQLSVPLAEARGLSSGIFSFFIPLKGEAHTHNFSVTLIYDLVFIIS